MGKTWTKMCGYLQDRNIMTDFDISKEAGGSNRPINRNYTADVTTSVLKIHLYWNGRGTCCIPHNGTYGPLVSAIRGKLQTQYIFYFSWLPFFWLSGKHWLTRKCSTFSVFPSAETQASPPPAAHTSRHDEKRRGVVAGIAALSIAATVISSSAVYLWWKWVSLVKHRKVWGVQMCIYKAGCFNFVPSVFLACSWAYVCIVWALSWVYMSCTGKGTV